MLTVGLALGLTVATAQAQERPIEKTPIAEAVEATPPEVAPAETRGNPVTVFSWDEMPFVDIDVGRRARLMSEATRTLGSLQIHITTLNPGQQSHAPHRHANEEVIVLKEGELDVYVNGVVKRIGPGSVMMFLSNDWHSVNNVGDTPATYHVINFHPDAH